MPPEVTARQVEGLWEVLGLGAGGARARCSLRVRPHREASCRAGRRGARRQGGRIFVETMHRDAAVASFSRGVRSALRLPDGTLMLEEPRFDAVEGRVRSTWHWAGPKGFGQKRATLRRYSTTEIVRLLEEAGCAFRSAHAGCSSALFESRGPDASGRLGILAERAGAGLTALR